VHAVIVWGVVVSVQHLIYESQKNAFLPRRYKWLQSMPHTRSATILVENIPQEYCSDQALHRLFTRMVCEESVESAVVVKKTAKLTRLVEDYQSARKALAAAKFEWKKKGLEEPASQRPSFKDIYLANHDAIEYYEDACKKIREEVTVEKERILEEARKPHSAVNSNNGFVTFTTRMAAKVALQLQFSHDQDEFLTSIPPDPSDVIYSDLQTSAKRQEVMTCLGHLFSFALFAVSVPVVVGISYLTQLDSLRQHISFIDSFLRGTPPVVNEILEGPCASLGLTVWMSLLPTFFMTIYYSFFKLTANAWAQHQLQVYYFWFMVFFGIIVAALSGSLYIVSRSSLNNPFYAINVLVANLPRCTHFYLGYMAVQWWLLALDLTRLWNVSKFVFLRAIYEEAEAREFCEPEDQDYYGMGGRSARATYNMLIPLVFCSLSPLITLLAFINFVIARLFYAYLFVFAETPKPDLGGVFWVTQLQQLQQGMVIYIVLMLGVLANHGGTGPVIIAAPSLIYLYYSYRKFGRALYWKSVPFTEVVHDEEELVSQEPRRTSYVQPELDVQVQRLHSERGPTFDTEASELCTEDAVAPVKSGRRLSLLDILTVLPEAPEHEPTSSSGARTPLSPFRAWGRSRSRFGTALEGQDGTGSQGVSTPGSAVPPGPTPRGPEGAEQDASPPPSAGREEPAPRG